MVTNKDKIIDSFLILARTEPLSLITNNQIIQEANVSRGTYYRLFHNKTDIIKSFANQFDHKITHETIKYCRKNDCLNIKKTVDILNIFSNAVLPILYQYRDKLTILFNTRLNNLWESLLENHYERLLKKIFPNSERYNIILLIKCVFGIIQVLWMDSYIPMPAEDFKIVFDHIIRDGVHEIFIKNKYYNSLRNGSLF